MRSCAALVGACIMTPIGTRFAWTMNGTSGPRSGCPQVAIGRAVGGAVGWAGDMVGGGRRPSLLLTIEFLRGPAGQPSPLLPPECAVCDAGLVSSFRENVAVRLQRRCRPNCWPHLPPSSSLLGGDYALRISGAGLLRDDGGCILLTGIDRSLHCGTERIVHFLLRHAQ